jgi:hypothetical protein
MRLRNNLFEFGCIRLMDFRIYWNRESQNYNLLDNYPLKTWNLELV